ncbi:MAG: hypothetical protein R3282_00125 [Rhodothermales bacterium]|nr:hypothetical protein [Rhodothermales bacterium]
MYERDYAGIQAEAGNTMATPYMGFICRSTRLRQTWTGDMARHIFESLVVRLMKDHECSDTYRGGAELPRAARAKACIMK